MLAKRFLKVSVIVMSTVALGACSTETPGDNASWDGTHLTSDRATDSIHTQGVEGGNDFYSDERGASAVHVGDQTYYFGFDKSDLHERDMASLRVQANHLNRHPQAKILITGNTDERGSREYNIALGQRRASSVKCRLQQMGVSARQMLTVSYGAEKPVAFGHLEEDYAKNRHADLQYQSPVITDKE